MVMGKIGNFGGETVTLCKLEIKVDGKTRYFRR